MSWPRLEIGQTALVDGLQLFARLKAYGLSRRNVNFGAGARVASYTCFPRTHIKNAKSAQFNAFALAQGFFHAVKHGFHSQFSLGFGNSGFVDHFVNDIELNHGSALLVILRKGVTCRCYWTSTMLSMEQFRL